MKEEYSFIACVAVELEMMVAYQIALEPLSFGCCKQIKQWPDRGFLLRKSEPSDIQWAS